MYLSTGTLTILLLSAGQALGSGALQDRSDPNDLELAIQGLVATYVPKDVYTRATAAIPGLVPDATAPADAVLISALAAETPPAWLSAVFGPDDDAGGFYQRALVSEVSNLRAAAGAAAGATPPPPPAPAPSAENTAAAPPAESTAPPVTAAGDAGENGSNANGNGTEATSTSSTGAAVTIMADLAGVLGVAGLAAVAL
ncbi:hypothetical protein MAPG_06563 [Magnaporthiopsis poae ATCC 64411]|uniref:Uncharacterized protein n=1 Tax=Magnaporthiopsis poae (strain ATCC 64411 / 73-15) TaxID=644358 RepID=A0A0C4E2C9_MAGP6|nr:hypothetical protein MAPG_06563 [Magnaporthiopsis poae ATCC 64411]